MNLPYKDYILIIKHTLEEGPGIIEEVFQKNCVNYIIVEFERGEKLPKELENIKGVISLGGDMNVYEKDKYPFLTEEELFIN
ncbi:MAG: hypothetical protein NZ891_01505, partial [bacterium]|nr:hypothetical protein [bacterium]MDW8163404.1 hypothetical protein [Candidatus Omnitrophota bacterium]